MYQQKLSVSVTGFDFVCFVKSEILYKNEWLSDYIKNVTFITQSMNNNEECRRDLSVIVLVISYKYGCWFIYEI